MDTSAQVAVRILPLRPNDPSFNQDLISYKVNTIKISGSQQSFETDFSKVFGPLAPQEDIFNFIYPVIESFDKGISSTIFTYGQSRSGKTFTMFGGPGNYGIIPRAIFHIFRVLSSDYIIRLSMIEIYDERITDLFEEIENLKSLCIRQHRDLGTYIDNISEYIVKSPDEALSLFQKGLNNCLVKSTMMSSCRSRINIISQINIISTRPNENGKYYRSKITLCDLSGSERMSKRVYGSTLKEDRNISICIMALKNVVNNLTKSKRFYIPYRDSKLTFLLEKSLDGQNRLAFIASLNPKIENFLESYDTIKFAHIFKQLKINTKNQEITYKDCKDIEKFERDKKLIKIYRENTEKVNDGTKINQEKFQDDQNFYDKASYKNTEEILKENVIMKNMMMEYIKSTESIVKMTDHEIKAYGFTEKTRNYRQSKSCSIDCRRNTERICFKKRSRSIITKFHIKLCS